MQKVILIGDSIRAGYEEIVRRELAALATVHVPRGSGGNSQRILEHLEERRSWSTSTAACTISRKNSATTKMPFRWRSTRPTCAISC